MGEHVAQENQNFSEYNTFMVPFSDEMFMHGGFNLQNNAPFAPKCQKILITDFTDNYCSFEKLEKDESVKSGIHSLEMIIKIFHVFP